MALGSRPACGQPYPGLTPAPSTTDEAKLHGLANQREIVERIGIAFAAERRSDWGAAVAELQRVISLGPLEPQASTAFYDLGVAQSGLREYDAAAKSFQDAIARDPGFLAARANLVTVRILSGDLPAARIAADTFLTAAPQSARALYTRGVVALRSGDGVTALADFKSLTSSDPAYAVAHYDLALAERELGRFDDAERELRTATALAPNYARAHLALGAVLLHEGKRDAARKAFDDAASIPGDLGIKSLAVSLRDSIVR